MAIVVVMSLWLSGCSGYTGQITNAPPPSGQEGPPLLTNGYAP